MLTTDGPEKNTLQWAPDGINFEIQAVIQGAPRANGLSARPISTGGRWKGCAGDYAYRG
jgi:hypothetical protein